MTWHASQMFIKANKDVVDYIKDTKIIRNSSYLLDLENLKGVEIRNYSTKNLNNFLLVIKDICDKKKSCDVYEEVYFGEESLDYKDFRAAYNVETLTLETLKKHIEALPYEEALYTPEPFLAYCKAMSMQYHTVVCYFKIFMWGGSDEYAIAWVFDPLAKQERIYLCQDLESGQGCMAYNGDGELQYYEGKSVLEVAMKHFEISLQDGYFEPHAGRFDWERFRL